MTPIVLALLALWALGTAALLLLASGGEITLLVHISALFSGLFAAGSLATLLAGWDGSWRR